jgi:hypothetical protein
MMGHKGQMKGAFEYDALTRWRKVHCYMDRPGVAKAAKANYNRRQRRLSRAQIRNEMDINLKSSHSSSPVTTAPTNEPTNLPSKNPVCPHCGHCPHCGSPHHPPYPHPYTPWKNQYSHWEKPTYTGDSPSLADGYGAWYFDDGSASGK